MKTRSKKTDIKQVLRQRKAKDWVRYWIFSNTAFERLNPEE